MTYRNRALLDLCHEAPCLLLPSQHECAGQSEPCHSDMIRHGRGEHHKSHDCFAVPGCHNAHLAFTRTNLGKDGYHAAWTEAMERYILWQWVTGKVRLSDITQRPKESTMEAPMCKICETRHYVREPHQFGPKKSEKSSGLNVHEPSVSLAKSQPETGKLGRQQRINSGRDSRRDGKNTSREGRRVLKPAGTRTDRDHLEAQPTSPPRKPGGNGTAAKPKTASKKKANKRGKKKCKSSVSTQA